MSQIIAFPFSIGPNGTVRTVEQGTEEEADQILRVICSTVIGERPMEESFGIFDPAFLGFAVADVHTVLNDYGFSQIELTDGHAEFTDEHTQRIELEWSLRAPEESTDASDGDDDDDDNDGDEE